MNNSFSYMVHIYPKGGESCEMTKTVAFSFSSSFLFVKVECCYTTQEGLKLQTIFLYQTPEC